MALQERTEPATPRRRDEARKKGQVARSVEVNSALVFIAALLILRSWGNRMSESIRSIAFQCFTSFPTGDMQIAHIARAFMDIIYYIAVAVLPVMVCVAVVGFISNAGQVGLKFSWEALVPDFNRINPLTGIVRMFTMRSAVEIIKSIAKVTIVGWIIYSFLVREYTTILGLVGGDHIQVRLVLGSLCLKLLWRAAFTLVIIGVLDYGFQRYQHEMSLRMTREEVKEEYKRLEGDPSIKAKIRGKQRAIARQRMMSAVPTADAVITNPTHYAVAIKYDPDKMSAPTVVAKGAQLVAQRIKEIARLHNVPVVENKPLAQALYKSVEIGDEVPAALYKSVAEILAFIYRMNNKYGFGKS